MPGMSPRTADPETRTAVLEAAARVLGEEGPAALTTRRLAAEAGTSTMAVYSRFGGMAEIRRAVRELGFDRLDARLDALPPTDDPVADLVAAGAAFYAAGLAEPYLYRAMFLDPPVEDDDIGGGVYRRLLALVERCLAAGRFPAGDAGLAPVWAAELWSLRHGMVTMAVTGMLPTDQARFVVDDMTYRLLVGFGDEPDRARRSLAAGNHAAEERS
jgi:AcrR family transcriptional regulator